MLQKLPAAGADVIELGIPFSDPMADGPTNQASYLRALKSGMTLIRLLDLASDPLQLWPQRLRAHSWIL